MKNTLSIKPGCICSCVDSIADNTNRIVIEVEVGDVTSPKLKISKNGTLQNTINLTANQINSVQIPTTLFTANADITFQYLDDDYTGKVFTIKFPTTLEGNLSVTKTSEYVLTARYTQTGGGGGGGSYELPVMTTETLGGAKVGSNMGITPSGHLFADIAPTEALTNLEIDAICTFD